MKDVAKLSRLAQRILLVLAESEGAGLTRESLRLRINDWSDNASGYSAALTRLGDTGFVKSAGPTRARVYRAVLSAEEIRQQIMADVAVVLFGGFLPLMKAYVAKMESR
jgi:predicted transcriptional regulator